jgi:hypothetical protein
MNYIDGFFGGIVVGLFDAEVKQAYEALQYLIPKP